MKAALFILIVVVFLAFTSPANAEFMPMASGGQLKLPSNCCCVCMKGGYYNWISEKLEAYTRSFLSLSAPGKYWVEAA